mmetsp:Transcript_74090/g.217423  ORF Transcript_74090/g.217423 Transcript_74090/m.217423 type:complete len:180 (+) Transcript_74090:113-652(+)
MKESFHQVWDTSASSISPSEQDDDKEDTLPTGCGTEEATLPTGCGKQGFTRTSGSSSSGASAVDLSGLTSVLKLAAVAALDVAAGHAKKDLAQDPAFEQALENMALPSLGSIAHGMGTCHACHYVRSKGGCRCGKRCGKCHFMHPRKTHKSRAARSSAAQSSATSSRAVDNEEASRSGD